MPLISVIDQNNRLGATILSHTSLLARELGSELQAQNIDVDLLYLPSAAGDYAQYPKFSGEKNLSSLSNFRPAKTDYLLYLYPSLGAINPSEYERFFHLLAPNTKIIIVDEYHSQSRLDPLLNSLKHLDYRLALLTDPFGPFHPPQVTNPILKSLTQAENHQPLTLDLDGQSLLYPTFVQDLIPGLIKALFNSGTRSQTFHLSTLESITQQEFIHQLKPLVNDTLDYNPPLEYNHKPTTTNFAPDLDKIAATQAQLNWIPNSHLEPSLSHTLALIKEWYGGSDQHKISSRTAMSEPLTISPIPVAPPNLDPATPPSRLNWAITSTPRQRGRPFLFLLLILFLIVVIPPTLLYYHVARGSALLFAAYDQLEQGSPGKARETALKSQQTLTTARTLLSFHRSILFFAFQKRFMRYDQFLDIGTRLSQVVILGSDSVADAQDLYYFILTDQAGDFASLNSTLKSDLDSLYNQLSLIEAGLNKHDIQSSLPDFDNLNNLKSKLPDIISRVGLGINLTKILPEIIGTNTAQTYLLLIQNNSELRPTGGYIAAYGLATFQNGKLTELKFADVYSADAKLDGEVTPPEPLKTHLGEDNWYLRDSNWSPHFPSSAKQAEWFINKELGAKVDGVVALNLFVLSSLLEATGPLDLQGQSKPITPENFFEVVEYGSQITADSQNTEILLHLTTAIFSKLRTKDIAFAALTKSIDQSLNQTQLLLYLNNKELQSFLQAQNWDGSLNTPSCPVRFNQTNCLNQTFALIESNLGVNRSNYFLGRRLSHELNIGDNGSLNHTITVDYQNNAPSNSWPAGRYKTYTRLYVPLYTELLEIKLDDQTLEATNFPDPDLGLGEIAFLTEIPAGESKTLTIKLKSAQILNLNQTSTLALNWQKQSGTSADPLTLKVLYPDFLLPEQLNQSAVIQGNSLLLPTALQSDLTLAIQFARQ